MEDVGYVMSIGLFLAFILGITVLIQASFPSFQIIDSFSFIALAASFLAVAGTCVIATGIPCAGALAIFGALNFFVFSTTVAWVIFTPLTLTLAYIVAKLGRGTV